MCISFLNYFVVQNVECLFVSPWRVQSLRVRKKGQGKTAGLKGIMLSTDVIQLLLCKVVQQVIQKINIITNNIFLNSVWAILENGYYNFSVKEFYL